MVVVDDSATQRQFVRSALANDPGMHVVGEARNGRDAVNLVARLRPEAVLMDLNLPVMNGFEAIERIMATRPTPIVVYSAFVAGEDRANAASALAAGAVDVVAKPAAGDGLERHASELCARLRSAGVVSRDGRLSGPCRPSPYGGGAHPAALSRLRRRPVSVVAIGASTGGPQALARLLQELPTDLSAAVVVVQHMADGFIEGLASWLATACRLPVSVGSAGDRLTPGTVTVAPSGGNLVVDDGLRVSVRDPSPGQYHVPGIDVTLAAVADACGAEAVGVLLTGMGTDGAKGLKRIRDSGGFTFGQDESSCVVFGMPAAAAAIGAVDLQLPPADIGRGVRRLVARAGSEAASR